MKPILKVVDKLGRERKVKIVRKVDIEDFLTGKDYITPEEYDENKCSRVQCSTGLKIKPEVIQHLLKKLKIEAFEGKAGKDSGLTYRKRGAMGRLTHEWHPEYAATFYAEVHQDISYKGLRKAGPSRENKWRQAWESNTLTWRMHREVFLKQQFAIVDKEIEELVKKCNQHFEEELIDFVQNINVDAGWLEEKRDGYATSLVRDLERVEEDIKSLKAKRSQLDLRIAQFDRENVVKYLLEDDKSNLSEDSKERVRQIAMECADKLPTNRSRRFG